MIFIFISISVTLAQSTIFFFILKYFSKQNELKIETKFNLFQDEFIQSYKNDGFQNRSELQQFLKNTKEEIIQNMEKFLQFSDKNIQSQLQQMSEVVKTFSMNQENIFKTQSHHISSVTQASFTNLEILKNSLEKNLTQIRIETQTQLDKIRYVVDEKLQSTLEQRLNASFKLVGDRIDTIHVGLGEMQKIASEVNSLQKILSNVKSRGILGEIQLDRILCDLLTPEQYEKNVKTKIGSNAFVEYAIKIPNKSDEGSQYLWLPIDAKFPTTDYQNILETYEKGDMDGMQNALKSLEQKIKSFAKDIKDKYIDPPFTTDFSILFLPTEGLYAEVLRIPGLSETLMREHQIIMSGPSTLAAFLNSLQLGFKTLSVEKRTKEIARLLSAVKTDFYKFGELLEKTQKKLDEASKQIGDATFRSKQITRKLTNIEILPIHESQILLELEEGNLL